MTIQLFIQNIEKYFGMYENKSIKSAVQKFISDNWKESELTELLNQTIKQYPTQYKSQPDVSFFNKLWEDKHSPQVAAEKAWMQLEELKADKSILCTDIIMQETIVNMGGVNAFLDYRLNERNWCKKAFIETYCRLSKMDLGHDFKILKSNAQIQYPKFPPELFYECDVKVIGNEQQGWVMLEEMSKTLGIEYKANKQIEDFKTGEEVFSLSNLTNK